MMWAYGDGGGWGWMAAGWITMVAFWVLVIVGIVAVVRRINAQGGASQFPETPTEILRRRYAAGELTKRSSSR